MIIYILLLVTNRPQSNKLKNLPKMLPKISPIMLRLLPIALQDGGKTEKILMESVN